jgi:hypothetical protein
MKPLFIALGIAGLLWAIGGVWVLIKNDKTKGLSFDKRDLLRYPLSLLFGPFIVRWLLKEPSKRS